MSVFYFIDTSISKHVDIFFDFSFSLEDKRGLSFGELIRPFCIMILFDIYRIMGCYFMLCHNTYVYSLLFYKDYHEEGNAGSWNSGWKRSKYWKPILHSSKNPETPRKSVLELIRIIERRKHQRGPTPWPGGWGRPPHTGRAPLSPGPPDGPPVPIFCYMKAFTLEKKSEASLRDETPPP